MAHSAGSQHLRDACVDELKATGLHIVRPDQVAFNRRGETRAAARVGDTDEVVQVLSHALGGAISAKAACRNALQLSSLHHPHIVQLKSIRRTHTFLHIVTEHGNGGSLHTLMRAARSAGPGLPVPAARFLFQQLLLAVGFCHRNGIHIRDIHPSNLHVFWGSQGLPTIKLAALAMAKDVNTEGAAQTPVIASMYTCPQMIRQAGRSKQDWQDLAPVSDVWSCMVVLYYLLTGRLPFTQADLARWADPSVVWRYDEAILDGLDADVKALFVGVFRGGGLDPDEYRRSSRCLSVADIAATAWFETDLPANGMRSPEFERSLIVTAKKRRDELRDVLRQELESGAVAARAEAASAFAEAPPGQLAALWLAQDAGAGGNTVLLRNPSSASESPLSFAASMPSEAVAALEALQALPSSHSTASSFGVRLRMSSDDDSETIPAMWDSDFPDADALAELFLQSRES